MHKWGERVLYIIIVILCLAVGVLFREARDMTVLAQSQSSITHTLVDQILFMQADILQNQCELARLFGPTALHIQSICHRATLQPKASDTMETLEE